MYGDRITGSMERAITETQRRRTKQIEFNRTHGIEPKTIRKEVQEIMEGARGPTRSRGRQRPMPESTTEYASWSLEKLLKEIKTLEKRMYRHARDLEFEEAACVRDKIEAMRQHGLGFPESKAG